MHRQRMVVGLCLLWLTGAATAAAAELETARVEYRELPRTRVFDGVVEARHKSTVSAQTSGEIVAVYFDVEDYVEKGAVLLRFRDTEQRARLAAAEAAAREAEARATQAAREYRRARDLYKKKLISRSALDKAEAEAKSAEARLRAARAEVERAREQLEYTVVRAPYSGIVTARHIQVGEQAHVGQPLMTGISLEALRVSAWVPQSLAHRVRAAEEAGLRLPDGRSIALEVAEMVVFPYADAASHTFRIRFDLPRGVQDLYPGMYADLVLTLGVQRRLVMPAAAVAHRSEVTAAYVVEPSGRVVMRQVRTGERLPGGLVEVLAGLEAGDRVAMDPVAAAGVLKAGTAD